MTTYCNQWHLLHNWLFTSFTWGIVHLGLVHALWLFAGYCVHSVMIAHSGWLADILPSKTTPHSDSQGVWWIAHSPHITDISYIFLGSRACGSTLSYHRGLFFRWWSGSWLLFISNEGKIHRTRNGSPSVDVLMFMTCLGYTGESKEPWGVIDDKAEDVGVTRCQCQYSNPPVHSALQHFSWIPSHAFWYLHRYNCEQRRPRLVEG